MHYGYCCNVHFVHACVWTAYIGGKLRLEPASGGCAYSCSILFTCKGFVMEVMHDSHCDPNGCLFPNCTCSGPPEYNPKDNWFITKVLLWILVIVLIVSLAACSSGKYTPRYDKYDKNGLIKSSTPLFLDKSKGKKVRPAKR